MPAAPARIEAARAELAAVVASYRALVGAASKASGASLPRIDAALAGFEPGFFNNLLVALDARIERRAGEPAAVAEVRLLADAVKAHGGTLAADPAHAYDADASLLRLEPGDRVALGADDFEALCAAFLDALDAAPGG
jgi:hypothetical protein